MALTRRVATVYNHVQDVASTTWTIVHNLHDYPIVDVYVDSGGDTQKIIPKAITYVNDTTCIVSFTTAYSGHASVV